MLGEVMERVVLRGRVGRLTLCRLSLEPARAEQHAADSPITDDDIGDPAYLKHRDAILSLLDDLDALTSEAIAGWEVALPLSGAITRLVVLVEALAGDADGDIAALYADEAGDVLARHLRGIIADGETFAVARADLPDVLAALFTGQTVKPKTRGEARVEIWGTLEARLQSVDLMVVGGLNEGAWPGAAQTGAFLSRTMGQSIGLEPPERRVGQSAHDFAMALGAPDVIMTRAKRSGTEPAIRSRWLERLMALLGEDRARPMLQRGEALRRRAGLLEASEPVAFASRPNPRPPVEHRPRSYSVTEIETLRRDAYAIYAKKVLKLRPLPPLLSDPTSRERGLLYHSIMARVLQSVPPFDDPRCEARLTDTIDAVMAEAQLPPDIALLWRQRFGRIVPQLIAAERKVEPTVARHHLEIRSDRIPITPSGTRIRGIADRIDETSDGLVIIDYKTGGVPSQKDIIALEHPQLPLEAALVRRGAFADVAWQGADRRPLPITDLIHIQLGSRGEYKWTSVQSKVDIDALAEEAWSRAVSLVVHHEKPETGFVSRGNPLKSRRYEGDYDHLARILEWSAGGPDADGDGDGDGDFDD